MTSVATSIQTLSSSDWVLLSGNLLSNHASSSKPDDIQLDPSKADSDAWMSCDDGSLQPDLHTGEGINAMDLSTEDYEPIQISIFDEPFQSVWSSDYMSLSQRDSPSEFASKFKHSWDAVQCSPSDPIQPPYKGLFFHGMTTGGASFFKKPSVSTADVGVQTMTTSIPRFPVACRSHPVPWGLDTDEPSPLVYDNSLDHNYTGEKRRLEDDIDVLGDCPPRKKLAFGDQDPFQLNHLFDFLKSPINDDVDAHEELVSETAITCKYEGLVIVDQLKFSSRVVSTNTMHIPKRREAPKCIRSKAWSHAAKQFLSEEDRLDKRGPRQGTREDRTNRMVNTILAYYCR